ncbi:unnamed protein product [Closterium sp. NIES-64]|nr:unnamed protein product [Closterium sp. NIES-64]
MDRRSILPGNLPSAAVIGKGLLGHEALGVDMGRFEDVGFEEMGFEEMGFDEMGFEEMGFDEMGFEGLTEGEREWTSDLAEQFAQRLGRIEENDGAGGSGVGGQQGGGAGVVVGVAAGGSSSHAGMEQSLTPVGTTAQAAGQHALAAGQHALAARKHALAAGQHAVTGAQVLEGQQALARPQTAGLPVPSEPQTVSWGFSVDVSRGFMTPGEDGSLEEAKEEVEVCSMAGSALSVLPNWHADMMQYAAGMMSSSAPHQRGDHGMRYALTMSRRSSVVVIPHMHQLRK